MSQIGGIEGRNWLIGLTLGIVGILIGGYLWALIAIKSGIMSGVIALISAGLAGISFGFPTRGGDKFIRGLLGAFLGVMSIFLGYYFIYLSPINLGPYSITTIPAEYMSFKDFLSVWIEPIDFIFFIIGIYEGYRFGSL